LSGQTTDGQTDGRTDRQNQSLNPAAYARGNDKNLVPEPSVDFYLTAVEKGLGMRSFYASINIL